MQYIYLKPQLENLSQGERIAFVRQFRRMTQDEYLKYYKFLKGKYLGNFSISKQIYYKLK